MEFSEDQKLAIKWACHDAFERTKKTISVIEQSDLPPDEINSLLLTRRYSCEHYESVYKSLSEVLSDEVS